MAADGEGGAGGRCWGTLTPDETFDFVFGSDLLYEAAHAEVLPKVIGRRLARPGGRCRIVGAVRNRAMLDTLRANLEKEGLRAIEEHLDDNHGDDWYEDGYAALEISHAST